MTSMDTLLVHDETLTAAPNAGQKKIDLHIDNLTNMPQKCKNWIVILGQGW